MCNLYISFGPIIVCNRSSRDDQLDLIFDFVREFLSMSIKIDPENLFYIKISLKISRRLILFEIFL